MMKMMEKKVINQSIKNNKKKQMKYRLKIQFLLKITQIKIKIKLYFLTKILKIKIQSRLQINSIKNLKMNILIKMKKDI